MSEIVPKYYGMNYILIDTDTHELPIDLILSLVHLRKRILINQKRVKVNSLFFKMVHKKGTKCAGCGLEASYFLLKRKTTGKGYHLALVGHKKGKTVFFTKDHIVPKSLNGENDISNLQPMCEICNMRKGNNIHWRYEE